MPQNGHLVGGTYWTSPWSPEVTRISLQSLAPPGLTLCRCVAIGLERTFWASHLASENEHNYSNFNGGPAGWESVLNSNSRITGRKF